MNAPGAQALTTGGVGAPDIKENKGLSHLQQLFFHNYCDKLVTGKFDPQQRAVGHTDGAVVCFVYRSRRLWERRAGAECSKTAAARFSRGRTRPGRDMPGGAGKMSQS
jgi:hypothetical protein